MRLFLVLVLLCLFACDSPREMESRSNTEPQKDAARETRTQESVTVKKLIGVKNLRKVWLVVRRKAAKTNAAQSSQP